MWETRTRKLRKRHTPFGSKRTVRAALDRLFDHFSAPRGPGRLLRLQRRPRTPTSSRRCSRRHRRSVRRIEIPHRYAFGTHAAAARRTATEYVFVGLLTAAYTHGRCRRW